MRFPAIVIQQSDAVVDAIVDDPDMVRHVLIVDRSLLGFGEETALILSAYSSRCLVLIRATRECKILRRKECLGFASERRVNQSL